MHRELQQLYISMLAWSTPCCRCDKACHRAASQIKPAEVDVADFSCDVSLAHGKGSNHSWRKFSTDASSVCGSFFALRCPDHTQR